MKTVARLSVDKNRSRRRWIGRIDELAGPAVKDAASIVGDLADALDSLLTTGTDTGVDALDGIADAAGRPVDYPTSAQGQHDLQDAARPALTIQMDDDIGAGSR